MLRFLFFLLLFIFIFKLFYSGNKRSLFSNQINKKNPNIRSVNSDIYYKRLYCKKDGKWDSVKINSFNYINCNDKSSGLIKRYCNSEGEWENIDFSECKNNKNFKQIEYISYPPLNFTEGIDIGNILPILYDDIKGYVTGYSITPDLKNGLNFNNKNGVFSGIPNVPGNSIHTVTVVTEEVSFTVDVTIYIFHGSCEEVDGYKSIKVNETGYAHCDSGNGGYKSRLCTFNGVWGDVNDYCEELNYDKQPSSSDAYVHTSFFITDINENIVSAEALYKFTVYLSELMGLSLNNILIERISLVRNPIYDDNSEYDITIKSYTVDIRFTLNKVTADSRMQTLQTYINSDEFLSELYKEYDGFKNTNIQFLSYYKVEKEKNNIIIVVIVICSVIVVLLIIFAVIIFERNKRIHINHFDILYIYIY